MSYSAAVLAATHISRGLIAAVGVGKVTGLAAHAEPAIAYPIIEKMFGLDAEGRHFNSADFWCRRRTARLWSRA